MKSRYFKTFVTFIILVIALVPFHVNGQISKINTTKYSFSMKYMQAPVDVEFYNRDTEHRYAVAGSFEPSLERFIDARQAEDAIYIPGWHKVWDDGNPSIYLLFQASDIHTTTEVKIKHEKGTDSNGRSYDRVVYQPVITIMGGTMSYKVSDLINNRVVSESGLKDYTKEVLHQYTGNSKLSQRDAERDLQINLAGQQTNAYQKWVNRIVDMVNSDLKSLLGWSISEKTVALITTKEKDFDGNIENNEHYLEVRRIIETMDPMCNASLLNDVMSKHITYYNSILDQYTNTRNKNVDLRMRALALYNLAAIYYVMEDYKTAAAYANKYVANNYEPAKGKTILNHIDNVLKYFSRNSLNTLHPLIEL